MYLISLKKPKWHPSQSLHWKPVSTVYAVLTAFDLYNANSKRPMAVDQAGDIAATYWIALDIMTKGDSAEEHWATVVFSLNLGMILCEMGIGAEHEQTFIHALDGAFKSKLRAERTNAWRFDGPTLIAVREALQIHDAQLEIATKEEVREAIAEVHRRVSEGHTYEVELAA